MAQLLDIHTHHLTNTQQSKHILNVFAQEASSKLAVIKNLPFDQKISIGLHPWDIGAEFQKQNVETTLQVLIKLVQEPQVFAVGETGLDKLITTDFALQESVFLQHILLSEDCQKPLIVHCVKSYDKIAALRKLHKPKQKWILHGFNAHENIAKNLIDLGCMLSFGHLLLDEKTKASRFFANIPLDFCFLETDNNQTPLLDIYTKAAKLKNLDLETLTTVINQNFLRL
jgi:TatD DNase family protein